MSKTPPKRIVVTGVSRGLGLAIPLSASLKASTNIIEIGLWGAVTVVVQLLVFRLVDMILRGLPKRIQEGEISAAALLVTGLELQGTAASGAL